MAGCYAEILAQDTPAAIQSSEGRIRELIRAEGTDRAMRSINYQMHAARFPIHRDLVSFDFEASRVDRALIEKLAELSFVDAAHNVVLMGGTGTGKSHLATALGVRAIQQYGKRVLFYSNGRPHLGLALTVIFTACGSDHFGRSRGKFPIMGIHSIQSRRHGVSKYFIELALFRRLIWEWPLFAIAMTFD